MSAGLSFTIAPQRAQVNMRSPARCKITAFAGALAR
jgi:hypothetical protein